MAIKTHSTAPAFIATRAAINTAQAAYAAAVRRSEALDDKWGEAQQALEELVASGLGDAAAVASAEGAVADARRVLDAADKAQDDAQEALTEVCVEALKLRASTPAESMEKTALFLTPYNARVTALGRISRHIDSFDRQRLLTSTLADLHRMAA